MPDEFYKHLANNIDDGAKSVLATMKHTRIEPAYRNRKFIVYEMVNRIPEKLATLAIMDFVCDDEEGCSTQIEWLETGDIVTVGHRTRPIRR